MLMMVDFVLLSMFNLCHDAVVPYHRSVISFGATKMHIQFHQRNKCLSSLKKKGTEIGVASRACHMC